MTTTNSERMKKTRRMHSKWLHRKDQAQAAERDGNRILPARILLTTLECREAHLEKVDGCFVINGRPLKKGKGKFWIWVNPNTKHH